MSDSTAGEYTVIARRFRPQTFDELLGQEHIARALAQAITSDRVGHAYLFTGARGVGKTSAARILAKALNCVRGPTPTPCNSCDICQSVAASADVDVIEIDGASNNGVDEVRELRQNAAVRPSRARYKIYIIDEVHMLSKQAFNALLKTLEEPPEHVKFIFATTEPHKIPITILSRCQRFDFAGIRAAQIQSRLLQIAAAEGVEIESEAVQILASRAAGSMRDSQSLLEQLLAAGGKRIAAADVTALLGVAPAERLSGLVRHLVERNATAALAELQAAVDGGADSGQLLDQLAGYFRDVMVIAAGSPAEQLLYVLPSQADEVADFGRRLGLQKILAMTQIIDQAAARLRLSMHGRTLLEIALVRICHLDDLDDLATLVAELRDGADATASAAHAATAAKKNSEPAGHLLGQIPPLPELARTKPSAAAAPAAADSVGAMATVAPAPGGSATEMEGSAPPLNSVLSQFQQALKTGDSSPPRPQRPSRREQMAEIAERPIVRRAMELFDVPPGQFRYVPPEGEVG